MSGASLDALVRSGARSALRGRFLAADRYWESARQRIQRGSYEADMKLEAERYLGAMRGMLALCLWSGRVARAIR